MKNDMICKLNELISQISPEKIEAHIRRGDLDDFIWDWRMEIGAVPFGLYVMIDCLRRKNDGN